jgi:hypothetical protein
MLINFADFFHCSVFQISSIKTTFISGAGSVLVFRISSNTPVEVHVNV